MHFLVCKYEFYLFSFSLDEGQCWSPLKFCDHKIKITGVSAEPGENSTDVTIWGWDQSGDQSWMAITVDFEAILGQKCKCCHRIEQWFSNWGPRSRWEPRNSIRGTAKRSQICGFSIKHPIELCLIRHLRT